MSEWNEETVESKNKLPIHEVAELNDSERNELILQKTATMIKELIWFVLNDIEKFPETQQKVSRINRLLIEIGMHYSNSQKFDFTLHEKDFFEKLRALNTTNHAELIGLVLPLYLSVKARTAKELEVFPVKVQITIFLKSAREQLKDFIENPDHEKLLELGITFKKTDLILSKGDYENIEELISDMHAYLRQNFLSKPDSFNITKAGKLLERIKVILANYGFEVQ